MKILHMLYGLKIGGAETFVYNVLSCLSKDIFQIDIAIQDSDISNQKILDLCQKRGCGIHFLPKFNKKYFSYLKELTVLLEQNEYDVVHIHMNALINTAPIYIANRRVKRVIVHSHSTRNGAGGRIGRIVHEINKKLLRRANFCRVSCGEDAGRWMFGNNSFLVLDNAIAMTEFRYNELDRQDGRKRLGISEKTTVIGHVGRFIEVKNHTFLLETFSKYLEINPKSVLVMVGDGELFDTIKEQVKRMSLCKRVFLVGNQKDVKKYYSCFDCMLFPSKFEGLPFVLIEAQANGLPIIASDRVTKEIDLFGNMRFVSLDASMDVWVSNIKESIASVDREKNFEIIAKSKYNIDNMIKKVEKLYFLDVE